MQAAAAVAGKELSASLKVAVVGVGLIGGSVGSPRAGAWRATVGGYDRCAEGRAAALRLEALDEAGDTIAETVAGAQAVFVGVPVGELPAVVGEALAAASGRLRRHRRRLDQARRGRRPR